MIRICHLTCAHKSDDTRIFHKECLSLAASGYEVFLIAPGESRYEKGVHIIGIGILPTSRLKRMSVTAKKVYNKAVNIDANIYHLHDPELIPYGIMLKKMGKTVIFDSHEDITSYIYDKEWIASVLRKIMGRVVNQYLKSSLPKLDAIISVSPHLHRKLQTLNPRVCMVTNYPIIVNQPPIEHNSYNENHIHKLVFVGGVSSQWSHEYIIRAIQDIQNIEYVVYGKGDDSYIQHLKDIDKANKFIYKGILLHADVRQVLSNADIGMALCQYSNNTGGKTGSLGNTKLFEYMMAGIPVVCTEFELWKNIVEKHQCGICVDPCSVSEIRAACLKLIENRSLADQMGMNGKRAVVDEYSWEQEEEKLINLYQSLSL